MFTHDDLQKTIPKLQMLGHKKIYLQIIRSSNKYKIQCNYYGILKIM